MSDRKYRQRGYQDEPRREPRRDQGQQGGGPAQERPPREMRAPQLPSVRRTAKCARCGAVVEAQIVLDSRCTKCGADLHSCGQCVSFDPAVRFECTQRIPARVSPKDAANACTFFEARSTVERETRSAGPSDARRAFDDLFKF